MAKLVVRYQNLQLVILGEGPARDYLQRLIVDLGLQNVVILPGAVSNPYRWMAFSDLFVMPSRSEGFPTALAEAMSLGCTVISCNCPDGPDEIIRHQHDGLLIPVDDDQALIEAMQVLIDDPLRCKRFGAAARGGINLRFSKSRVLAQWQKLILEVSG